MGLVIAYRPERCGTTAKTSEWERAGPKKKGGAGGLPPRLFASGLSLEKAWIPRRDRAGTHLAGANLRRSKPGPPAENRLGRAPHPKAPAGASPSPQKRQVQGGNFFPPWTASPPGVPALSLHPAGVGALSRQLIQHHAGVEPIPPGEVVAVIPVLGQDAAGQIAPQSALAHDVDGLLGIDLPQPLAQLVHRDVHKPLAQPPLYSMGVRASAG